MSRHSWMYNNNEWRRLRRRQLSDHPLCAFCQAKGRTTLATVADHIEPHRGDTVKFWHGELQSLCKQCHDSTKQAEERRGYSSDISLSGWPVDPKHPSNG